MQNRFEHQNKLSICKYVILLPAKIRGNIRGYVIRTTDISE